MTTTTGFTTRMMMGPTPVTQLALLGLNDQQSLTNHVSSRDYSQDHYNDRIALSPPSIGRHQPFAVRVADQTSSMIGPTNDESGISLQELQTRIQEIKNTDDIDEILCQQKALAQLTSSELYAFLKKIVGLFKSQGLPPQRAMQQIDTILKINPNIGLVEKLRIQFDIAQLDNNTEMLRDILTTIDNLAEFSSPSPFTMTDVIKLQCIVFAVMVSLKHPSAEIIALGNHIIELIRNCSAFDGNENSQLFQSFTSFIENCIASLAKPYPQGGRIIKFPGSSRQQAG